MAVGDTYISAQELSASLNIQGVADLSEIDRAIRAASRAIDNMCHRVFWNAEVASPRRYRRPYGDLLGVADFHTTTGLVVKFDADADGVYEETVTDYLVEPSTPEPGWPYTDIILASTLTRWVYRATSRRPLVEVTAVWGWASVPAPVEQACLLIAKKLLARRQSPDAIAAVTEQGAARILSTDPDAQALLAPYVRYEPVVA